MVTEVFFKPDNPVHTAVDLLGLDLLSLGHLSLFASDVDPDDECKCHVECQHRAENGQDALGVSDVASSGVEPGEARYLG